MDLVSQDKQELVFETKKRKHENKRYKRAKK